MGRCFLTETLCCTELLSTLEVPAATAAEGGLWQLWSCYAGAAYGMPTVRPCDQEIVPDSCAVTGGLVSVHLDITVTAGGLSEVWRKNAVVFISRRDEFIFGPRERNYIQEQSRQIGNDFGGCLTGQVNSVLGLSESSASAVDLTQVADCVSNRIAAPQRLRVPPRGVFISHKDIHQFASISSADLAACMGVRGECVDAPAQSFGQGHVIANAQFQYKYGGGLQNTFLFTVLLPVFEEY